MPALFFSAATLGVSGFSIHFALLRPGNGNDLEDLFVADPSVSNQSEHIFWSDATISASPIFVTADWTLGPDESHYSPHRYIISAYALRASPSLLDGSYYYLEDRYMTVRKYSDEANYHILATEKQEILARLTRVKAETDRQQRTPR
jgi:hypothetical protein